MPTDLVGDPILIPTARFELLSPDLLRAYETDDGKKMIHGVASSTTKDLHGDVILRSALEDMERSAVGMTIFRNHSYNVPDDVAGSVQKAHIETEGTDQDGEPNHSLHFDIEVEEEQPEAVKSWRMVKNGRRLGLSIGAMIPPGGARKQKDGSYVIEHINLLETSIVGIPANPKSWVQYAKSALDRAVKGKTTQLGNPTLTLDGDTYRIEGSMQGLELNLDGSPSPSAPEVEITHEFAQRADGKTVIWRHTQQVGTGNVLAQELGAWDLSDPDELIVAKAAVGEDIVAKATVWVETRDGDKITIGEPVEDSTQADAAPDTTKGCSDCKPGDPCDRHKDVEPDVADAKVRIIEVDTDAPASDGGQGASSDSEPDDADTLSVDPEVVSDGEPVILDELTADELTQLSFGQLRAAVSLLLRELGEARERLAEEKAARIEAEHQREAAFEAAADLVRRTTEVIEKVANSPLPRKAALKDEGRKLSQSIEAYYGPEMARVFAGQTN